MNSLVVIESAFSASDRYSVEDNIEFARKIMAYAIFRGYAPFASHLLYPQKGILDDADPIERAKGIALGYYWGRLADQVWFALRPEEKPSIGMLSAWKQYKFMGHQLWIMRFTEEGEFIRDETANLEYYSE